jgi:hypothetical protein
MSSNGVRVATRRRVLKTLLVQFLGGECVRCGWKEHQAGLHAHHVNPSKKGLALNAGGTPSWERMKEEARKCVLLCANCHAVVHITKETRFFDEEQIPEYADLTEAKRSKKSYTCCVCGSACSNGAGKCWGCGRTSRERIEWPPVEELQELVRETSFVKVGKDLGVSDNAVRKRIKNHSPVM